MLRSEIVVHLTQYVQPLEIIVQYYIVRYSVKLCAQRYLLINAACYCINKYSVRRIERVILEPALLRIVVKRQPRLYFSE